MSQRHLFKQKNADEKWQELPDKSGMFKEEKCENCHCIRMSIRYKKDPFEIFYRFKREEGHEYSGTVLKCGDGYKRNYDRSRSENGKPIFLPKKVDPAPVSLKEEVVEAPIEIDYEQAETIADLLKKPHILVPDPSKQVPFDEMMDNIIVQMDRDKHRHEEMWPTLREYEPTKPQESKSIYLNGEFVSEEQARLDECLILIKLLKDHIEEKGLSGFSKELRIAARILKLNKIT